MTGRPVAAVEFAALMAPLGPFEPEPHLAVAVSGGADSMALTLLAAQWAAARGGRVTALVVDHGLRAQSADEAALTIARLAQRGIPAHGLKLHDLARGPALAERARAARHAVFNKTCAAAGIVHLLLGHHAGDQAETLAMRALSGSGPTGLAGMAALVETHAVRLLRPLLRIPPGRLRATLCAAGVGWVEDPSNADPSALRARIRAQHADPDGTGTVTGAAAEAASRNGDARQAAERAVADELAACAAVHPGGYATIGAAVSPAALAALVRTIAGAPYPPPSRQVERLAAGLRPATIGGVRILPAPRRLTPDPWLVVRESSAMAPPVPARCGAVWDGRFRITADSPAGMTLGALGADASRLRRLSPLPAAVLRTLPALRLDGNLVAVPHLRYVVEKGCSLPVVDDCAPAPVAGSPFVSCQEGGLLQ